MLWIEIAFPDLSTWQWGAQPPLCAGGGGRGCRAVAVCGTVTATAALSSSDHGLCWHYDEGCVCQWVNLLLAPSKRAGGKKTGRLYRHKQLFEAA